MAETKDTGSMSLGATVRIPLLVLILIGAPGIGGLALGSTQLARSPSDIGEKMDALVVQVGGLATNIATLTTEVRARDRADDRERARVDDELRQIKERLTKVEERQRRADR